MPINCFNKHPYSQYQPMGPSKLTSAESHMIPDLCDLLDLCGWSMINRIGRSVVELLEL
jgi:hypothetical protein